MKSIFEIASLRRKTRSQTTIQHKPPPSISSSTSTTTTRQRSKNVIQHTNTSQIQLQLEQPIEDTQVLEIEELIEAVRLPKDEIVNNWLLLNVIDFCKNISLLSTMLITSSACSKLSCPVMCAGQFEYLWIDKSKKSAIEYQQLLFDWINQQINIIEENESTWPKNYFKLISKIMSRLFRIFAHIYVHHYNDMTSFGSIAHLNTLFIHFMLFSWEFKLIDKSEMKPLKFVIERLFDNDLLTKYKVNNL